MVSYSHEFHDLEGLRTFVYATLCGHDQLEPDSFAMSESLLMRATEPCGMYFCLHGPRQVKYTAIWETDRNTILFYGPSGERFRKSQLIAAPELSGSMNEDR
ncbi:MAG: hypothetical protein HY000_22525 [Planctomycetes bacterium]|nr:hypothetical protein [Planctomycetota bacterium]